MKKKKECEKSLLSELLPFISGFWIGISLVVLAIKDEFSSSFEAFTMFAIPAIMGVIFTYFWWFDELKEDKK